jgi:hypothetical protein
MHAAKDYTAESLAEAIIADIASNGLFDTLVSDMGSDLTSKAIELVSKWMGYVHRFAISGRHQSNGVEGPSHYVLERIRAICADNRILTQWSRPHVLKVACVYINNQVSSETGVSPFEAKFGTFDAAYFRLPSELPLNQLAPELLRRLNEQLKAIREHMMAQQEVVVKKRAKGKNPLLQNLYQAGDFVLKRIEQRVPKLSGLYLGPFEVLSQHHNTVQCRHLCSHVVLPLDVELLKIFHGSKEEAEELSRLDHEQHLVLAISGFVGDPLHRMTCEFEVTFMDGDVRWTTWQPDITSTQAFEKYCSSLPHLHILLEDHKVAKERVAKYRRQGITVVKPKDNAYLNLALFPHWFFGLEGVLDVFHLQYFTPIIYKSWSTANHKTIGVYLPAFDKSLVLDGYQVVAYGAYAECPAEGVLVDKPFVKKTPALLADGGPSLSYFSYPTLGSDSDFAA